MRPREFPAESMLARAQNSKELKCFNEAAGVPRGIPSCDARIATLALGFNEAAGVPRGIPLIRECPQRGIRASMRPREFPAESANIAGNSFPVGVQTLQ